MLLNFRDDVSTIQRYIARRVDEQVKVGKPIAAIEFGFQVSQAGLMLLHFDTREKHLLDFSWTRHLNAGHNLDLPHWATAYETALESGAHFILPSGQSLKISPGADEPAVTTVFGEALLAMALDAVAHRLFAPLSLRAGCELCLADFDGMWDGYREAVPGV